MKIEDTVSLSAAMRTQSMETPRTWAEETGRTGPPRILLTSVYGPYANENRPGKLMELLHNQMTCAQGAFSMRMFHNSWGIKMIQENISAPSAVLDFPTIDRFRKELTAHHYDIVGITSIMPNVNKVILMCDIIRRVSPHSKIIVGGHITAISGLEKMIDADHIARGEGICWMRRYLGEDTNVPIRHPVMVSQFGRRVLGIPIPDWSYYKTATIVPSVGCPIGCNFCATSAFFGGKGRFINFLKTGDDLYRVICKAESALKTGDFFIMDENFLLQKRRAMELLELMKANNKSWAFYVFSSANALRQYTTEELVDLGISSVWMGLESQGAKYDKLNGINTKELVRELQLNGIKVFGSTIIGMEYHTPENVFNDIEYAVSHVTDFHQFSLYTPLPGTPLYAEAEKKGILLKDADLTESPGLQWFNFRHPHISREDSKKFLDYAFQRDFEQNGPSIFRAIRTTFWGRKRHKNHPDARVRERFRWEAKPMKTVYSAVLWAMEQMYKDRDKAMSERMAALRFEMEKEFGFSARMAARLLGPVLLYTARREEERLARGVTYEPKTFIERKNWK